MGLGPKSVSAVPAGMRVYTVGDIHGCLPQLERLHAVIAADAASYSGDKTIVYLGDYIDRGPDSCGVIERLVSSPLDGFTSRYLKGNHEAAFLDFLREPQSYRAWRVHGAPETLMSYGVRPPLFDAPEAFEAARDSLAEKIPASHLDFLRGLEMSLVIGDYAFVHAGIRPGLALDDQTEYDLLWIREEFVSCTSAHPKVIVHGHTPVEAPLNLHNRIAVDTGAYATGILTAAVLEGEGRRFLPAGRTLQN
jgi:serine/threonine protein phosphatase 1